MKNSEVDPLRENPGIARGSEKYGELKKLPDGQGIITRSELMKFKPKENEGGARVFTFVDQQRHEVKVAAQDEAEAWEMVAKIYNYPVNDLKVVGIRLRENSASKCPHCGVEITGEWLDRSSLGRATGRRPCPDCNAWVNITGGEVSANPYWCQKCGERKPLSDHNDKPEAPCRGKS